MLARKESVGPVAIEKGLPFHARGEDDISGKVPGFVAESIADPSAHGGSAHPRVAGVEETHRRVVIENLAVQGADDGEFIRHLAEVGEETGDQGSALAVGSKGKGGSFEPRRLHLVDHGEMNVLDQGRRDGLTLAFGQLWFGIEGVHVRGAPRHEEIDDSFRPGREVSGRPEHGVEERSQGGHADSRGALLKEMPSGEPLVGGMVGGFHEEGYSLVMVSSRFSKTCASRVQVDKVLVEGEAPLGEALACGWK